MIAILGTGQVGRAVLDQLQLDLPGQKILLVNRSGRVTFELPAGSRVVGLDATRPAGLVEVFRQAELIFSCTDMPYTDWAVFYPALAVAMTEGLRQAPHSRLVLADNLYSYGNRQGQVIHEGLAHHAQTRKGRIRAELIRHFSRHGVQERVAIVKSSDFIGPRIIKGVFGEDFLRSAYAGNTVWLPGDTSLPHHFTYIEDFARAMTQVAQAADGYGHIWHVPNAPAISQDAWVALFARQAGLQIRHRRIPGLAVKLAGLVNAFAREADELSYQFQYPYLVSAERFISHFGDHATSHEAIVANTLAWFHTTTRPL